MKHSVPMRAENGATHIDTSTFRARVEDAWWCDDHQDVHCGQITDFNMDHRTYLRPLYVGPKPGEAVAQPVRLER